MAEIPLSEYIQKLENLIEQGRYDEVLASGRHILQHHPKHLATYSAMAKALLEAGQDAYAEDMFKRVLSGLPEDYLSRVGMSIIYDRQGELDKALWQMERAFELVPDSGAIRGELRRLYGRRAGVEPGRLDLTRGALARLYVRGALYPRAVEEIRTLLKEDPQRIDLRVALAEAFWRNEQRVQAEEVCLQVLDELPFCLKANLFLGEVYTRTGRAEGRECLRRAEMLDPENALAAELLGDESPLEPRTVRIPVLEYAPRTEERPAWMPAVGVPAGEEGALLDVDAVLQTQIEIPAWLEDVTADAEEAIVVEGEGETPPEALEQPVAVPAPAPEEEPAAVQVPDWVLEVAPGAQPEEDVTPEEEPAPAEVPDWLAEVAPALGAEELSPAAEEPPAPADIPDWLREMAPPEATAEAPVAPPPAEDVAAPAEELPAWLGEEGLPSGDEALAWLESLAAGKEDELRAAAEAEAEVRVAEITGRAPEREAPPAEPPSVPEAEEAVELPDWLREEPEEAPAAVPVEEPAAAPVEEPAAAPAEELPAWLGEEGLPSGDEALAWLESLSAGKEDELRAAAEAEAEVRVAEITGRVPEREAPSAEPPSVPEAEQVTELPDWLREEVAPSLAGPAAAPEDEEPALDLPEWLREEAVPLEEEPEEAAAAAPVEEPAVEPVEEPAAAPAEELPAWLGEEGLPSGDEALAWLESLSAGKEDELRAAAEAEAEVRVAEITGRVPEREAPPAEPPSVPEAEEVTELPDWLAEAVLPEEPAPLEEPPVAAVAEEEAFGWTGIGTEGAAAEPSEPEPPAPEPGFGWTGMEIEAPAPGAVGEPEEVPGVEEVEAPVPHVPVVSPLEEAALEEAPAVTEAAAEAAVEKAEAPPDEERLTGLREHLRVHRRDHAERLTLARELWRAGIYDESLDAYSRLLRSKKLVEDVLADLEDYRALQPTAVAVQLVLGDAYMRLGRLDDALEIYRGALEGL